MLGLHRVCVRVFLCLGLEGLVDEYQQDLTTVPYLKV